MVTRAPAPVLAPAEPALEPDFVHDQMASGRRFRVLNVVEGRDQGVPGGSAGHIDLGLAAGQQCAAHRHSCAQRS